MQRWRIEQSEKRELRSLGGRGDDAEYAHERSHAHDGFHAHDATMQREYVAQ